MTKIVKASEMARVEALSYAGGAIEEQFMRAAGFAISMAVQKMVGQLHIEPKILFLCGKGNNGGDGYVAATLLTKGGFPIHIYALSSFEESSLLSQKMRKEFLKAKGELIEVQNAAQIDFTSYCLIVDGLWGTGFKGELPPLYRDVILKANGSKLPILAIDIPSGINGDSGERGEVAIMAHKTLFLALPKRGCFIGESYNHLGEVVVADFGLDKHYIAQAQAEFLLVEPSFIRSLLPPLVRTRHKYEAGYVVGLGGSRAMSGAALLASEAALRAGAGIVRLLHPEGMERGSLLHEIICQPYVEGEALLHFFERAKALFIGPGMGLAPSARKLLKEILPKIELPCVLDADALTLLAEEGLSPPRGAILTPHKGEMKRLLHLTDREVAPEELLLLAREYAAKHEITLVLKGAPTFIFHQGALAYVVARGDPGMATAGSGDVLTGIIAAFLAQCGNPERAALLGCYLHGRSGELAAKAYTSYGMIASDIIKFLPDVFKSLIE